MAFVDPYTLYLPTELERVEQRAVDLEWDGGNADPLWERVKDIKRKIDDGVLYEPAF